MAKKNDLRPLIKLRSTAGTGYTYVTRKNRRNDPDRISLRKYDPIIRRHVEFKETRGRPGPWGRPERMAQADASHNHAADPKPSAETFTRPISCFASLVSHGLTCSMRNSLANASR